MKNYCLLFLLIISYPLFAQDTFQLAQPLVKYSSVFFSDRAVIEMKFAQSETEIHYTLNKQEPTINDPVYKKSVIVKNNFTTVKAKAFGNNFHPSETITTTFIKKGKAIQSIQQTTPNTKYKGNGANTLIDNKGGIAQLNRNTWMGYNCDTVAVTMNLQKEQILNMLKNTEKLL